MTRNVRSFPIFSGAWSRLRISRATPKPSASSERIRAQPYAPYAMAQAVVVQEQALNNLNEQVRALQEEIEDLRSRAHSGGFLSQLFGGGSREPERRPAPSFSQGGQGSPWGQSAPAPQPGMGQGGPWGG